MDHEVIVVGAGPAGLSAATTAAYYKLDVLVIDSSNAGGALINQYPWKKVDQYLGIYQKTGMEVGTMMVDHAMKENVKINENETVTNIVKIDGGLKVETSKGSYTCNACIIACGLGTPRKLGVEGETLKNVCYSLPDPLRYKAKKFLVIGGGDTAVECAIELKRTGADVVIAHRKDQFRATEKNVACIGEECVRVLWNTEVKKIEGDGCVECATLYNNKDETEAQWDFDGVLFSLGTMPNTDFLTKIGVKLDEKNNIQVDANQRTSIEGLFAAGDIVGKWIRIPQAVGEGGFAGLNAFKYVKNPYWG